MTYLIVYSSKTDNTKKLADTIYEELDGEKEICPVNEAPLPQGYDTVFVGFWLKAGKPDPDTGAYLEKFTEKESLFLFATHGAAADSGHVKKAIEHAAGLTNDADIKGVFTCQGEVDPDTLEKVKQKSDPPVWIGDADKAVGHPDKSDLDALREKIASLK